MIVQQIVKTIELPLGTTILHPNMSSSNFKNLYITEVLVHKYTSVNYIYKNHNNIICLPFYLTISWLF